MTFSPEDIPSRFDFADSQARIYEMWQSHGYFHAEPKANDDRKPFTIVIPPPNVTGALHLGHALNNTLQDIQIRMKRMQGYNTLWMPGTDHAGIATQAVVEKPAQRTRRQNAARSWARETGRSDLGLETGIRKTDPWPTETDGLQLRLGANAFHSRRKMCSSRSAHVL